MAGVSTSFVKYPALDDPRSEFQDNLELVCLVKDDIVSPMVDKNIVPTFAQNKMVRNQDSESASCQGCFQYVQNGHFGQLKAHTCKILKGSQIYWLFPAVIISIIAKLLNMPQAYLFASSVIGIAPLAERLGFVTEQLAFYTGPTVGGLLNATFGNATEMIISLFALKNGLIRVVQLSLLGSILSNMLLVLGCAFLLGGLAHPHQDQKFNQTAAVVNSGLLLMAVMGLLLPAVLDSTRTELHAGVSELNLSRFSSCVMLLAYALYLYFQLKSHRQLYDTPSEDKGNEEESCGNTEEACMSLWGAFLWLAALTSFISLLSNNLVDAIQGASAALNIPLAFISVIILPIVGNAAEHASAIMFALKDKLDLSLGVAIGSSTQISMFVVVKFHSIGNT